LEKHCRTTGALEQITQQQEAIFMDEKMTSPRTRIAKGLHVTISHTVGTDDVAFDWEPAPPAHMTRAMHRRFALALRIFLSRVAATERRPWFVIDPTGRGVNFTAEGEMYSADQPIDTVNQTRGQSHA
jgi:hypothetical protein